MCILYMKKKLLMTLEIKMKIIEKIRYFIVEKLFGKITREIRFRKRLKELRKRDPFIYKWTT